MTLIQHLAASSADRRGGFAKGGVGKTKTAVTGAAIAARRGQRPRRNPHPTRPHRRLPFDLPSPTLVLRVLQRRALVPRGAVGSVEQGTELAWLGNPLLLGRSAEPWDTSSRAAYGRR
jgi:hypothetical protein